MINKLLIAISLGALLSLLGGCVNMLTPLGENKYDCNRKEDPDSKFCHSFRAVDQSTAGTLPESRYDTLINFNEYDRLTGIAPPAVADTPKFGGERSSTLPPEKGFSGGQSGVSGAVRLPLPHQVGDTSRIDGLPVRIGPIVQRYWIKSFTTADDSLVQSTVVYKETVPTHWAGFPVSSKQGQPGRTNYPHKPQEPTRPSAVQQQDQSRAGNGFIQPTSQPNTQRNPATLPAGENGSTPD